MADRSYAAVHGRRRGEIVERAVGLDYGGVRARTGSPSTTRGCSAATGYDLDEVAADPGARRRSARRRCSSCRT